MRRRCWSVLWLALLGLGLPQACEQRAATHHASEAPQVAADRPFTDVTAAAGIRFRHDHGGTSPLNILQTAGSGCAFFDFDADGWLDILLLSGRPLAKGVQAFRRSGVQEGQGVQDQDTPSDLNARPGTHEVGGARLNAPAPTVALYRNHRDGTFRDVTQRSGLKHTGYAMGCAVGDVDGDADLDLYVTNYGANVLYRNNGDGTFTDLTRAARVAAGGWSTSAAFADADGDGDLDLFVTRYVVFNERTPQLCDVRGVRAACAPIRYRGESGILYRNRGDGTFEDVTRQAGVYHPDGRGLGVLWGDYDGDGDPDLFVANDAGANNLFRNDGRGRFHDVGLLQGVAYGEDGSAEASMGVDGGDYDNDGDLDFIVTNFQNETNALYRNDGPSGFGYVSFDAGIGEPSLPMLGFGVGFLDHDNDGDLDLFTANGHVQDTLEKVDPECPFAQSRQLFENVGSGRFRDLTARCGPALTRPAVGRGAAFGDYDNDGDVDILVNNNGGPAMLLRNDAGSSRRWLRVRLVGKPPNTFALGARVVLESGGRRQSREARSGSSYASASDLRLHFGLGDATTADSVTVRWPNGRRTVLRGVPANRELLLHETQQ